MIGIIDPINGNEILGNVPIKAPEINAGKPTSNKGRSGSINSKIFRAAKLVSSTLGIKQKLIAADATIAPACSTIIVFDPSSTLKMRLAIVFTTAVIPNDIATQLKPTPLLYREFFKSAEVIVSIITSFLF